MPVSLTPPNNLSAESLSPVNSFSAVSLTPVKNFRLFGYFSPVSTTPAINCSPVSTTPPINFPPAINYIDDRSLFFLQNYFRPPKLAPAADIVFGTAMKSCIHKHPTHLDQRPLRPPKLLQTKSALFSFGGLRGL
jgi:hypothetical protein